MRKLIALVLGAALAVTVTACSARIDSGSKDNGSSSSTDASTSVSTEPLVAPNVEDPERFTFSTVDRDGVSYTDAFFADHELTMINFWEPWCGPCVNEMPDIAKLAGDYADKGFAVLGVYSDTSMESDVQYYIDNLGVSYPLLLATSDFTEYMTDYVPTTFFVDKNGHVWDPGTDRKYSDNPVVVGGQSYEAWENIIKKFFEEH